MRCIRQSNNLSLKNIKERAPCYGRVAVMVGAVVTLALLTNCRAPDNEPTPTSETTPAPAPEPGPSPLD